MEKFLRNCWYVFGWERELEENRPLGKIIIGEPVVIWRDADGGLHAMEDRCPHRHAALSLGRVEGNTLRCMYHGMVFGTDGRCAAMPLLESPPAVGVRVYPVVAHDSWLWVWMGDPRKADTTLIPKAYGLDDPERPMQARSIEYEANYQLINDNLCDLSHVDFVHETTLKVATGADWSHSMPRVRSKDRSILIDRWFVDAALPGNVGARVDSWLSYEFSVPGVFVMRGGRYPAGTAARCEGREPVGIEPIYRNFEQQAVTPMTATRTAYHYATGLAGNSAESTARLAERIGVVIAAFEEDRATIEAQQRVWSLTPPETPKHFLPQDKGPFLMRKLIRRLIDEEASEHVQ